MAGGPDNNGSARAQLLISGAIAIVATLTAMWAQADRYLTVREHVEFKQRVEQELTQIHLDTIRYTTRSEFDLLQKRVDELTARLDRRP